jgi:hypothetical protein
MSAAKIAASLRSTGRTDTLGFLPRCSISTRATGARPFKRRATGKGTRASAFDHGHPMWPVRVEPGRSASAAAKSAYGAQRKHVTLPTDFRSPSENGHSRYGQLTARFAPQLPFAVRMRLCADSYLRDLAVDQVSANGRIRRCAGATCEIACFGFWPTADVAQTRSGRRHGGRKGDVALRAPAAERRYADSRGRSASPGRAPTFA